MPTIPYIHFQGQCAEALAFYAQVFNGTGVQSMTYAAGGDVPEDWKTSTHLRHAQVTIYDGTLMLSDYPPGVEGSPQLGFSVMQSVPDFAEATRVFAALSEGGEVTDAFKKTFFSPGFGMLKDRFGTHWIISAMQE